VRHLLPDRAPLAIRLREDCHGRRPNGMVWIVMAGVAVDEHTPGTPVDEGPPDARRRRWVRVAALCAGVVACAVTFGFVTDNEIATNTRFDQAHRSLDVTRGHLRLVRSDLATVSADLRAVDRQVGLDTTTLSQDVSQLQGVEAALAGARASVSNQTKAMNDLRICLGGVEQGLNALSVGDRVHAVSALSAVSTNCTAAYVASG